MAFFPRILFIAVLSFACFSKAASRCEYALLGSEETSPLAEPTKKFIGNEFDLLLNDHNMLMIDKVINQGEDITPEAKAQFAEVLQELQWANPRQRSEAEALLEHKITQNQAVALRVARGLGRTEVGADGELFSFSGNYTTEQIARKDRVLELAGFSFDDRVLLTTNHILEDKLTDYTASHLIFDNISETSEQAIAMNKAVIQQMDVESKKQSTSKRKQSLNAKEAKRLYEHVTRNPVSRLLKIRKYDPTSEIGFCFGRAFTAHLEALHEGIDKESIRKAFVVGEMKAIVGDIIWQFHVATLVKRSDGGWWVIDPFFGKVTTLEEWYQKMYKQDIKGTLRLYITEASRLGALGNERYQKIDLMEDYYNEYFKDLLRYYRQKAKGELPAKPIWMKIFDTALSLLHLGI